MDLNLSADQDSDIREPWVEPTLTRLDVRDTAYNPNRGGDGNLLSQQSYPDCTRS